MLKNVISKISILKIFFLIKILKEILTQNLDYNRKYLIAMKAKKFGYDLSNPKDDFFNDICITYSVDRKDITLDYKRKYFFFSENKEKQPFFGYPKRNNTISCFLYSLSIYRVYKNVAFLIFVPLYIYQIMALIIFIIFKKNNLFNNTPLRKIQLIRTKKCFCSLFNLCKTKKKKNAQNQNFIEFIPEININQNSYINNNFNNNNYNYNNTDNYSNDTNSKEIKSFNDTLKNLEVKDTSSEIILEKESKNSNNEENNNKINLSNKNDLMKNNILDTEGTADFDNDKNDTKNIDDKLEEKIKSLKSIEENDMSDREKSIDNYTFGMDIKIGYNFDKNDSNKDKEEESKRKENKIVKEDKLKKIQYIYNSMNQKINKIQNSKYQNKNSADNYIPPFAKDNIKKTKEITYIREEYFYFGYLLSRIEDKRSITRIYLDLLEQCQIIFKFFLIPFNIYEDRKLQILYYTIKINFYFIFNCYFIKASVINDIYDKKNKFINDFYRSILSCFFSYIIVLYIYSFINLKKDLIKLRYKLLHLKISDQRIIFEIQKLSFNLYMKDLFKRLNIFFFLLTFIFIISLCICSSFCFVYEFTQIYVIKCVFLSILVSQLSPFLLCWIPSFIRKISILKKKPKLYALATTVEMLFIA